MDMGALKNRDFIYKGLQFHLNDSKYHNEFTPKYLLMFWNDSFGYWQEQIHVVQKRKLLHTSESAKSRTAGCLPDCS